MNVRELIEQLQQLPQDSMVVVRGYEGGVNEADTTEEVMLMLDVNSEWYYGSHEVSESGGTVPAVKIG